MNPRKYLDEKLPRKISDLAKYLSSYSIATAASLLTKSLSSWLIARLDGGNLTIAVGSSILCTAVFFLVKWPLYRWLHESRYKAGDSAARDRKVEFSTIVISSLVTNAVSMSAQYVLLTHYWADPAMTGLVCQLMGGAAGAVTKIGLDKVLGLVFPSEKRPAGSNG